MAVRTKNAEVWHLSSAKWLAGWKDKLKYHPSIKTLHMAVMGIQPRLQNRAQYYEIRGKTTECSIPHKNEEMKLFTFEG